jgi:hypothetical protein
MPQRNAELLEAVDLALEGDWQAAHRIAQEREDDAIANWIHAVVHRIEGDLGNARYWYRRCRRDLREAFVDGGRAFGDPGRLAGSGALKIILPGTAFVI